MTKSQIVFVWLVNIIWLWKIGHHNWVSFYKYLQLCLFTIYFKAINLWWIAATLVELAFTAMLFRNLFLTYSPRISTENFISLLNIRWIKEQTRQCVCCAEACWKKSGYRHLWGVEREYKAPPWRYTMNQNLIFILLDVAEI